ncbi:MAG: CpsD/CapB family tyrosine-protein kinase [Gammaproteobacteria bacterium]|nr:CpsD/CapB family tyrosine-protein kinase [Gammaproteobacteria bacterium]MBI5616674.1 CpsD/CapB family tyrosine-protein kinase [Gammaproteobacteria bacterium]
MIARFPGEVDDQFLRGTRVLERLAGNERFALAVSSCYPGAGTSSVACSLARALAKVANHRVCLVEANVRTPGFAAAYGLNEAPGFCEFMTETCSLDAAVQVPTTDPVSVVTAGLRQAGNPWACSQAQLARGVQALRERFDIVLFDTSPLLAYSDTATLAGHLDGLILVLEAERDNFEVARLAVETAAEAGAKTLAAVLNKKPLYIPQWLYKRL